MSRPGVHGTDATALLDRARESAALNDALGEARAGRGGLMIVEGPGGIGKTSLLAAARDRAKGMEILSARGSTLERDLPFGIVRQLLDARLRRADEAERARLFAGGAARCEPVLLGEADAPGAGGDAGAQLVHSLHWLLATLADDAPLLVLLDDAHWSDSRSLDLIAFLAPRLRELAMLVVVATRPPEAGSHTLLLDAGVAATRLRLGPLSESSVSAMLEAQLEEPVDPAFAAACGEVTGANPFYVRELARQLAADRVSPTAGAAARVAELGSQSVAHAVFARIAGQPPAAVAVSRTIAVLGDDSELRHVAALARLDVGETAHIAAGLTRAEVLADANPLSFAHPILRASIYSDLAAPERAHLHAEAARMLSDDGAPASRVAQHLLYADAVGEQWAVDALRAAARAATAAGAPVAAAAYLRRALAEPVGEELRPELLRELGAAEFVAGEPGAIAHLEEALAGAGGPVERALIVREMANPMLTQGRLPEALELLDTAATTLDGDPGSTALALELQATRCGLALVQGAAAAGVMEPMRRFESAPGDSPTERLLLAYLAYWRAGTGATCDEAAALAERALANGLLADTSAGSPAFAYAAFVLIAAERFTLADGFLADALDDARRRSSAAAFVLASSFRSLSAYRQGRLEEAEAEARAAVLSARDHGYGQGWPIGTAFLADALVDRGRLDEARSVLAADSDASADRPLVEQLLVARGRLALASGDLRAGADDLLAAGELSERGGSVGTAGTPTFRTYAAPALAALGEHDDAGRMADEELALARVWGAPRGLGMALHAAALVAEGDARLALLHEAVAVLAPTAARLEHARALLALGETTRRAGDASAARDPLGLAAQLARECGAAGLADRAEDELAATGARRTARTYLSGLDSLTPSERRIARMAASGASNREIAQDLFLTRKTVESHLSHVYRKLGVAGRADLAAALDA